MELNTPVNQRYIQECKAEIEYIVKRWPTSTALATQQATIIVPITAANHIEALNLSGLKEPDAMISVNAVGETKIRYQVDAEGKVIEVAMYGISERRD